ncbi:hypothetical protein AAC387_Pa05g2785 [Persea americana]
MDRCRTKGGRSAYSFGLQIHSVCYIQRLCEEKENTTYATCLRADLSAVIPSDFAHKTFIAIYMLRFQGASYLLLIEQIKKLQ